MDTIGTKLPLIASTISTTLVAISALPMLIKAFRTKDLKSYSWDSILLTNVGNLFHSVYVFQLPMGPIWLLHSFYLLSSAALLVMYLRYERQRRVRRLGLKQALFCELPSRLSKRQQTAESGSFVFCY